MRLVSKTEYRMMRALGVYWPWHSLKDSEIVAATRHAYEQHRWHDEPLHLSRARAVARLLHQNRRGWRKRAFTLVAALLLFLSGHYAHCQTSGGSYMNFNLARVYNAANNALQVYCVGGTCSGTGGPGGLAQLQVRSNTNVWTDVGYNTGNLNLPIQGSVTANQGGGWSVSGSGNFTVVQPTGTNLHIVCDSGCGGAASFSDQGAFTAGTTAINVSGGVFNDGLATVSSGQAASPRLTSFRAFHVNLRNNLGTEIGTAANPIAVAPGTGATFGVTQSTSPWVDSVTTWGGGSLGAMANYGTSPGAVLVPGVNAFVTNIPSVAQSGAWTVQQGGAPWSVSQSGTWTVQPGNTANTTPWLVKGSDGTNAWTVKATSTAAVATDTSLVVQVSPSQPAFGVNISNSPTVAANQGTPNSSANGWPVKVTDGTDNLNLGGSSTSPTLILCDNFAVLDMTTATTTQMVALTSGKTVYICSYSFETNGAASAKLVTGTGTNCATGQTAITANYDFTAQTGIARGSGLGMITKTPASQAVCATSSAAVNVHVDATYAQF